MEVRKGERKKECIKGLMRKWKKEKSKDKWTSNKKQERDRMRNGEWTSKNERKKIITKGKKQTNKRTKNERKRERKKVKKRKVKERNRERKAEKMNELQNERKKLLNKKKKEK